MKNGSWGRLQSTIPPVTPCAWTSFKTGVNPGKHGVFDFFSLDEDRNWQINFSRFRGYKSIWKILSEQGLRCCVYNVPFTYPPEEVNGILISGLLTPSLRANFTSPAGFKNELLGAIPDFKIFSDARYSEKESDVQAYIDDLFRLIDIRFRTATYLLDRESWDFFMMVFSETDSVQHWFWKYIDPSHPDYSEEGAEKFGNKIFEIYRDIDERIGHFLKYVDDDTLFLIISDHGAGPFIKRIYVNNWLKEKKYLYLKRTPRVSLKRLSYKLGFHPQGLVNLVFKLGLARLDTKIPLARKQSLFSKLGFNFDDIDWKRTVAYSFGSYGQIYINSVENHKDGIVDGEEVSRLREEIVMKLRDLVDPVRGINVLDRVWFRDEIYHGPHMNLLPDITLSLDNFSYASSTNFAMPSNDIFSDPLTRKSGDHRVDGVFMAYGRQVVPGIEVKEPSIMDVAPTILDFLDIEVPDSMDGTPLNGIFR
jgi:predicted AlkP superfamily phosphohydrolase/phosphomutase